MFILITFWAPQLRNFIQQLRPTVVRLSCQYKNQLVIWGVQVLQAQRKIAYHHSRAQLHAQGLQSHPGRLIILPLIKAQNVRSHTDAGLRRKNAHYSQEVILVHQLSLPKQRLMCHYV